MIVKVQPDRQKAEALKAMSRITLERLNKSRDISKNNMLIFSSIHITP